MNLNEGLRINDLKYLVSNYISIDQYTSKLDDDNITVAFFCNEKEVAEDLRDFIEKIYYIEIRDIEISDSLTEDNKYILFVEFERNITFPKLLMDMIDSINNLTDNKDWKFKTFGMHDKATLSLDNIQKYVRLAKLRNSSVEDMNDENLNNKDKEKNKEAKNESYQPFTINDHGWKRQYIPERYISEEELNKFITESTTINSRDDSEIYLIESAFPGYQVITTDTNVFLIKKDKILMLRENTYDYDVKG